MLLGGCGIVGVSEPDAAMPPLAFLAADVL